MESFGSPNRPVWMLSAGGKTGFTLFQTYHIRDHFLLCPDGIFVHGTDWTKTKKQKTKTKSWKRRINWQLYSTRKDWFWTASCWVSTYIGLKSGANFAFSKIIGVKWTELPISCAKAFMADQCPFITPRVQQKQNTHY